MLMRKLTPLNLLFFMMIISVSVKLKAGHDPHVNKKEDDRRRVRHTACRRDSVTLTQDNLDTLYLLMSSSF